MKTRSGIQKLIGGFTNRHAQTAWSSHKPTLIFQNKETRLKMKAVRSLETFVNF
jgi:hypothetical protein